MKIRVELEMEVRAFTPEELAAEAEATSMSVEELCAEESDEDLDASAIGESIAAMFYDGMDQDMFGGSGIYAKLGDASLIRAEMVPA